MLFLRNIQYIKPKCLGPKANIYFPLYGICRFLGSEKHSAFAPWACPLWSELCWQVVREVEDKAQVLLSFSLLCQELNKNPSVISGKVMATWANQMEYLVQTAS